MKRYWLFAWNPHRRDGQGGFSDLRMTKDEMWQVMAERDALDVDESYQIIDSFNWRTVEEG